MKSTSFIVIALSSTILVACGGGDSSGTGSSAPIINAAPTAQAGSNQNVVAGNPVTLDGSTSSDADQDQLTYQWTLITKPVGSSATLAAATSAKPSFTADIAGAYVVTLVVNDGQASSTSSSVTITASSANAAPVAHAGAAQTVVAGSTVTLDGSASSDANNDTLTYSWTLATRPEGSTATLALSNAVRPTFQADVPGSYAATLVVNDGQLSSAATTVSITANAGNAMPVAHAGTAQNVKTGTTVTLDGSASSDANGDALTYKWTFAAVPEGSSATLNSTTSSKPSFIADVAGTYVATLTVNDGRLDSVPTNVAVTASVANAAPVANAGTPQTVVVGSILTLDGSASADANNDALTYQWTLTTKPVGSGAVLNTPTIAKPSFTADVAGDYVATLIVSDGKVNSSAATVTLKATPLKSVSLLSVPDSFFGGEDSLQPWPYSMTSSAQGSVNCIGTGCATAYDVATFKLRASGQSFTIANLTASNLTSGSPIAPLFSGLSNGQTIADGQTVTFKLQSPFTKGSTVNLKYSFTIKETGDTFNYTVQLKTN